MYFLYRATIKYTRIVNGVRLERGMWVEVQTPNYYSPMMTPEGRQAVEDAFYRRYGISLRQADSLSAVYIDTQKISY